MPRELAEMLESWLLNEMKRNETKNHEPDMTSASPTSSCHEDSGADAMDHKPQADEGSGECAATHNAQAGNEGEGHGVRARRPALTIWVKPNRLGDLQATGYLDRNGTKHALKFTCFDHALERIGNTDAAWHGFVSNKVAPLFLPLERQSSGIAGKATMSGLYGQHDTYARKAPTIFNEAIALEWDGEVPTAAFLIEGHQISEVSLHLESNNRYKGII